MDTDFTNSSALKIPKGFNIWNALNRFGGRRAEDCPPYHRVAGRARTPVRAAAGPGAFINDAGIIEPFMVREQVQRNREPVIKKVPPSLT